MKNTRTKTNTNTKVKTIATIIALLICIAWPFGTTIWAAVTIPNEESITAAEAVTLMNNAEKIKIVKNYATWFKKDYAVIVDDQCVGHVKGNFWKFTGDVFTFESGNGEIIAKEDEEILHITNQAQFYDKDGNKSGRYEKEFWSLLPKSYFFDENGEKKATVNTAFLKISSTVKEEDETTYTIDKNFFVSEYTIKNTADSNMKIEDIILIVCINDAINTSSSKSDD